MNPIEIEEQLSKLASEPFDAAEFPFQFLECYGRKAGEIKSLKQGKSNKSDIDGVLQRNNIHLVVARAGELDDALTSLRNSKATTKNKAHFILTTDGENVAAENLKTGDHLACDFAKLGEEFTFFLPLAGIYFTAEIKNQDIDVKATARLNKLYMELLRENPDWGTAERRHDLNQFMARLIFCFFAEDTDIFHGENSFTNTLKKMSDSRSGNVTEVIAELFQAMDTPPTKEARAGWPHWKDKFPYVNGGLFGGNKDIPKFSRIARSYMIAAGELNWSKINPDIFGSMIQAVADEDERGSLGMHYTSVPNILKVLNPLFLDDLREKLEEAGDSKRKLLNLRKRIANIRVFDPACGSGNFLVIAYKELRKIEAEILDRRGDENRNTVISLENFYGIEIKDFAAQIAQIALLIAEFQCDVLYINQVQACKNMLPLDKANNIVIGNALRLDWLEVCPPTAPVDVVKDTDDDLFDTPLEQTEINLDEDNLGGETYICGNPPYLGSKKKSPVQIEDMELAGLKKAKLLDYVAAFMVKAIPLLMREKSRMALVATSSICQGEQVAILWPKLLDSLFISFAYEPFRWSNSAAKNAGVFCTILGLERDNISNKRLFFSDSVKVCRQISPYLIEGNPVICKPTKVQISGLPVMVMGSNPVDGKNLIFSRSDGESILSEHPRSRQFLHKYGGTSELTSGSYRYCIWVSDSEKDSAVMIPPIKERILSCARYRAGAGRDAKKAAKRPHSFGFSTYENKPAIHVGNTIGNSYLFVPCTYREAGFVSNHAAFTIYDPEGLELSIISSQLHLVWAKAVAGRLGNGLRYGNTTVYNTFPVPNLSDENRADLTRCAEDILLARAAYFPQTIADLYKPEDMPDDLRVAHERNDETLERIYIGRRFKTDTERLETLFDLYTKMTRKAS